MNEFQEIDPKIVKDIKNVRLLFDWMSELSYDIFCLATLCQQDINAIYLIMESACDKQCNNCKGTDLVSALSAQIRDIQVLLRKMEIVSEEVKDLRDEESCECSLKTINGIISTYNGHQETWELLRYGLHQYYLSFKPPNLDDYI